jgi:hypothetical protein
MMVGPSRAAQKIGWKPIFTGQNPWDEGRHPAFGAGPLHTVSPFGAPAGRYLQSVDPFSADSYGVQQEDMGHDQGDA